MTPPRAPAGLTNDGSTSQHKLGWGSMGGGASSGGSLGRHHQWSGWPRPHCSQESATSSKVTQRSLVSVMPCYVTLHPAPPPSHDTQRSGSLKLKCTKGREGGSGAGTS